RAPSRGPRLAAPLPAEPDDAGPSGEEGARARLPLGLRVLGLIACLQFLAGVLALQRGEIQGAFAEPVRSAPVVASPAVPVGPPAASAPTTASPAPPAAQPAAASQPPAASPDPEPAAASP